MEIDPQDNNLELPGTPGKSLKKGKKLADLKKEIAVVVPAGSKVPSIPASASDLTETGDEYEKSFGFKRATTPPKYIVIEDRIMDAAKIYEVRTGTGAAGGPAMGILYGYPEEIGVKHIEVELQEGIDPMMSAKAVRWGLAPTIAPAKVRDCPPEGFLTMRPFKPSDLVDRPVLAVHKAAVEKELKDAYGARIASDKQTIGVLRDQLQKSTAARAQAERWAELYKRDYEWLTWVLRWLFILLILIWLILYFLHR